MSEKKEYPPMKLDDTFRFGKHKGVTLEKVLQIDKNYVEWLVVTKEIVELDNESYKIFKGE